MAERSRAARRMSDVPNPARLALLTGPVGAGKTTAAERVAGLASRRGLTCGGLLAPAMRNACGYKVGIWGMDVSAGERRILARTDRELGGPTVGPYSFDRAALEWAVGVIESALGRCDLVLVDEIGKLELWQGTGLAPILPHLIAERVSRILVVVRRSLLADLQTRLRGVVPSVFHLNPANRETLPQQIVDRLF